jgi:alpha-L-fucosidase-like protein
VLLLSRKSLAREFLLGGPFDGPRADQVGADELTKPVLDIALGPFKGTRESLREWQVPDWYRDAKFGIWAHWGPQSAVEYGDWYARGMFVQGSSQCNYHVKVV